MKKEKKTNKPIQQFKDYPVQISVWKKTVKIEKKNRTFYDCSVNTTYKDENDEYQTSSNFKETDLLKTSLLLQKAYNWIQNAKQKEYETAKEADDETETDIEDIDETDDE